MVALIVAGLAGVWLLSEGDPATQLAKTRRFQVERPQPGKQVGESRQKPKPRVNSPAVAVQPRQRPKVIFTDDDASKVGFLPEELLAKSKFHRSLADLLADFDRLKREEMGSDARLFADYRARLEREKALLEQIRGMGDEVIPAILDLIGATKGHAFQLLLAKALAGMDSAAARKASEGLLSSPIEPNVRMQVILFLPPDDDSWKLISRALLKTKNSNLRRMYLREFAKRTATTQGEDVAQVLRHTALEDESPQVRAEAIDLIGRRKMEGEREMLAKIIREDKHIPVRQKALKSLALVSGSQSLRLLESVVKNDKNTSIRASAIIALMKVGGEALPALHDVARSDPSPEIRQRAEQAIQSIRLAQQGPKPGAVAAPEYPGFGPVNPGGKR